MKARHPVEIVDEDTIRNAEHFTSYLRVGRDRWKFQHSDYGAALRSARLLTDVHGKFGQRAMVYAVRGSQQAIITDEIAENMGLKIMVSKQEKKAEARRIFELGYAEACQIANVIGHLDEAWGVDGREIDLVGVRRALQSPEVREVMDHLRKMGLAPQPRDKAKLYSELPNG